jgi:hypothetical protein
MEPPHTLTIDRKSRVAVNVYRGVVTVELVRRALEEQLKHPDFDRSFAVIGDFRLATFDVKREDIEAFAKLYDAQYEGNRGKTALLVDAPRETALSPMFQQRAQSRNIRVFSTTAALRQWLGLSESPAGLIS